MFKLIRRIVCFFSLSIILFVVIAYLYGGEPFRWLGERAEESGKIIKEISHIVADEIDRIVKKKESIEKTAKDVQDTIENIKKIDDKNR